MIATLAHELQHAVEVIEDELVSDRARACVALYKRIGRPSRGRCRRGVGNDRRAARPVYAGAA